MKTKFIKIAFILLCYDHCEAQSLITVLNKKVYEHHSSSITSMPYGYGNVNSLSAYDFVNHSFVSASSTAQNPNKDIVEHNGPYGNGGNFGLTSAVSNIGGFNYTGNGTTKFQLSTLTFSNVNNVSQIVSAYNSTLATTTINNLQVGQVYISKIRNTNQYVIMLITQVNNLTAAQINMLINNQQFNADVFFQFDYKYGTLSTNTVPTSSFSLSLSTLCVNSSITTSNTSIGSPTPTFSWVANPSNGVGFLPSSTAINPTVQFANSGSYTITCIATNSIGTNNSSKIVNVSSCNVGLITEVDTKKVIVVSPNPNNGKFIIKSNADEAYDLYILDQLGQLVYYEKNLNGNIETDFTNYSKGIYYAKIKFKDQQKNVKLIVE